LIADARSGALDTAAVGLPECLPGFAEIKRRLGVSDDFDAIGCQLPQGFEQLLLALFGDQKYLFHRRLPEETFDEVSDENSNPFGGFERHTVVAPDTEFDLL
jgi:hypothetical protein